MLWDLFYETDISRGLLVLFSCRALSAASNDFERTSDGRVYCEPMEPPQGGRSAGPAKVGRGGKK